MQKPSSQQQMERDLQMHTFVLKDRHGGEHHYVTHLHQGMESMAYCLRVTRACGTPLARFLESNAGLIVQSLFAGGLEGKKGEKLRDIFQTAITEGKVELELRLAVSDIVDVLIEMNDSGLIEQMFRYTERDGAKLSRGVLDTAYAGNVAEMRNAMIEIVAENGWLDFLFGGWGDDETTAPARPTPTPTSSTESASSTA